MRSSATRSTPGSRSPSGAACMPHGGVRGRSPDSGRRVPGAPLRARRTLGPTHRAFAAADAAAAISATPRRASCMPPRCGRLRATSTSPSAAGSSRRAARGRGHGRQPGRGRRVRAARRPTSTRATLAAAAVVAPLVAARHLLGDGLEERVARLRAALAELPPATQRDAPAIRRPRPGAPAGGAGRGVHARPAPPRASLATEAARGSGDRRRRHRRDAAATLGCCYVFAAGSDEGWAPLNAPKPRGHGLEAGRPGDRMLGTSASVLVEYDRADARSRQGSTYAETPSSGTTGTTWPPTWPMCSGRPAAGRRPTNRPPGAGRRPRRDHDPDHRPPRPGLRGARPRPLDAATAPRRGARPGRGWGSCSASRRRCGAWPRWPWPARMPRPPSSSRRRRAASAGRRRGLPVPVPRDRDAGHLAAGDPAAPALGWTRSARSCSVGDPGTLPAIDHAPGLLDLADGDRGRARTALQAAVGGWAGARRRLGGRPGRSRPRPGRSPGPASGARRSGWPGRPARGGTLGAPPLAAAAALVERQVSRDGSPDAWRR